MRKFDQYQQSELTSKFDQYQQSELDIKNYSRSIILKYFIDYQLIANMTMPNRMSFLLTPNKTKSYEKV